MRRQGVSVVLRRVPVLVGCLVSSMILFTALLQNVFPLKPDPVNKHVVRESCDAHLEVGEMCPPFYTDMGGKCELRGSVLDCPDIRHNANRTMRQAQLVMVRMLRIFHLIAAKHNIRYWLSAGTLIGAARHKGFIPWDHDVDIEMPLQDYVKFFTVGSKELPKDVFFQNSRTDIEFLEAAQSADGKHPTHPKIGFYRTPWNARLRDKSSCYGYCLSYGCKWHDGLMVDLFVTEREIKDVFPLTEMEFEGFVFTVPKNWKAILQQGYGEDVMEIPSERSAQQPFILPYPAKSCKKLAEGGVRFD